MSDRPVATDALATLGTILTEPQKRDAIHLAVLPAVAGRRLMPGDHVGIDASGLATNLATPHHGIVDPFLGCQVEKGEQFWLVIYPRVITSLRHVWAHPAFPDEPEAIQKTSDNKNIGASEAWLRAFCKGADCAGYDAILEAVRNGSAPIRDWRNNPTEYGTVRFDGEYIHHDGVDAHGEIPPEFWDHMETVLGRKIQRDTETYFSCSC